MGEVKAIETRYNGLRFRSRLEARWAVFFDACGVKYEYEPEGFVLPSGRKYLPDFLIHNCTERGEGDLWVEVKGNMGEFDAIRIEEFYKSGNRIFIATEIPQATSAYKIWNEMTREGLNHELVKGVFPFNFQFIDGDLWSFGLMANGKGGLALCGADRSYYDRAIIDERLTERAYEAARCARFEHGETPKVTCRR